MTVLHEGTSLYIHICRYLLGDGICDCSAGGNWYCHTDLLRDSVADLLRLALLDCPEEEKNQFYILNIINQRKYSAE